MQEFPLVAMFNLAASIVCLIAAVKMYSITREKTDNVKIRYFFYSFIFITIYLFAGGIPLLIVRDSFSVAVVTSLFRPFLLLGGMFLCLIPLSLIKIRVLENIYIFATLAVILVSSVLTFLGLSEAGRIFPYHEIEYWIHPESALVTASVILTGVFFILSLLFSSLFYFRFAMGKRKEEVAFGKAIMIGLGCFLFLCAVASSHILGIILGDFVVTNTVASLFFIMGVVSLIASVNYKGENKRNYYE